MAGTNVGEVNVDVKANLDPFLTGLTQAQQLANSANTNLSRELNGMSTAVKGVDTATQALTKSQLATNLATRAFGEGLSAVTSQMRSTLGILPALAGAAGIGAMILAANQAVSVFGQWQQQQIAFEGRMRATLGIIGLTSDEVTNFATQVSRTSGVPMQQLRDFMVQLGSTGRITAESLQHATQLLPDLAIRVGGFTQATQLMTQALQDPGKAMEVLRVAGIRFTQQQQDAIKSTMAFSDVMAHVPAVLDVIQQQIGGEGAIQATSVVGSFSALSSSVAQLTTNLGGAIDRFLGISTGARSMAATINALNDVLFPSDDWTARIRAAQRAVDGLGRSLSSLSLPDSDVVQFLESRGFTAPPSSAQDTAAAQLRLQLLQLGQAYAHADQETQRATRSQEEYDHSVAMSIQALQGQLWMLQQVQTGRAELRARQEAMRLGITDEATLRRMVQLYQQIEDANRRIAQYGRLTVYERENQRLEQQLALFRYGNEEMRVHAELDRIILAADRARQSLTPQQISSIESDLRALNKVKELTGVVDSAFQSVFTNIGNAVADFAATGKFQFKQFADGVIRDLVRIAMQAFVTKPLLDAITGFTNPLIATSMGVSLPSTSTIPHFATGGSFVVPGGMGGKDKPFLMGLTPGEHVDITPAGGRRQGGGAVTVVNNINSSRDFEVQQTTRQGPDGSRIVEQTFTEVMRRIGRGDADGTFGARFGMRPRTIQR